MIVSAQRTTHCAAVIGAFVVRSGVRFSGGIKPATQWQRKFRSFHRCLHSRVLMILPRSHSRRFSPGARCTSSTALDLFHSAEIHVLEGWPESERECNFFGTISFFPRSIKFAVPHANNKKCKVKPRRNPSAMQRKRMS